MWLWTSKLHAIAFTQFSYIALNNSPRTTNYNCIVAPKLSQIFVHLITNICSILLCRVRNKNGKYSRNICDCESSENFILPVRHFFRVCVCVSVNALMKPWAVNYCCAGIHSLLLLLLLPCELFHFIDFCIIIKIRRKRRGRKKPANFTCLHIWTLLKWMKLWLPIEWEDISFSFTFITALIKCSPCAVSAKG